MKITRVGALMLLCLYSTSHGQSLEDFPTEEEREEQWNEWEQEITEIEENTEISAEEKAQEESEIA